MPATSAYKIPICTINDSLRALVKKNRKKKPLKTELNYFKSNKHRYRYEELFAKHWLAKIKTLRYVLANEGRSSDNNV